MGTNEGIRPIKVLVGAMAAGLLGGLLWFSMNSANPEPEFNTIIAAPDFWIQYPALVLEGEVDSLEGEIVGVAISRMSYESQRSKASVDAELWPSDRVDFHAVDGVPEAGVPSDVAESVRSITTRFVVGADVAAGDSDLLIAVRDGHAVGTAFVATITGLTDTISAKPGADLAVVIRTWDDYAGTVIGTVPAEVWEDAEALLITVRRDGATVSASVEPTTLSILGKR